MICYMDRTYCDSDCTNTSCSKRLTEEVKRDAVAWWGSEDAPIATSDMTVECHDYQQPVKESE
jgi:hypothetical protein